MSKLLRLSVVSAIGLSAFSAHANYFSDALSGQRSGYYVGLDYWPEMDVGIKLKTEKKYYWEDADASLGLNVGVDTKVTDSFYVGYEVAYNQLGRDRFPSTGSIREEAYEGHAILVNVKPKYYIPDSDFYIAGLAGLGRFSVDLKKVANIGGKDEKDSDSSIGYQFGVETGYEFTNGMGVSFGYKLSYADYKLFGNNLDAAYKTFYVGARYKF